MPDGIGGRECAQSTSEEGLDESIKRPRGAQSIRRLALSFAISAVSLLLLTVLYPVAEAASLNESDGTQYYSPGSEATGNEVAAEFNHSLDQGLDYVRPHETKSFYSPDPPTMVQVDGSEVLTVLAENSTAYSYRTPLGIYSFYKSNPSTLAFSDVRGRDVAQATFSIESQEKIGLGEVSLAGHNESEFLASQVVLCDGQVVGKILTKTEFPKNRSPKITAWTDFVESARADSFSMAWNVVFSMAGIRVENKVFSLLDSTEPTPHLSNLRSFEISDFAQELEWKAKCIVDWSDAKCGDLTFSASSEGFLARVLFPAGMNFVDPTIVGSSSTAYATPGSPFRNVVQYDGVYWLFYNNGSSIVYSSSSDSGMTWSSPVQLPGSGNVKDCARSFDVAIQGNHVAVCWAAIPLQPTIHSADVKFIEGYMEVGNVIWNNNNNMTVGNLNISNNQWFGGVSLSMDGSAFIAYGRSIAGSHGTASETVTLKKSKDQISFTSFSNPFTPTVAETMPRFVCLPDGNMMLIVFVDRIDTSYHCVRWNTYLPSLCQWEFSTVNETSLDFSSRTDFSVCADKNGNSSLVVRRSDGCLQYIALSRAGQSSVTNLGVWGLCPSISVDMANDFRIQYMGQGCISEIRMSPNGGGWLAPRKLFDVGGSTNGLCGGERLVTREFLAFTEIGQTTKNVMFGAIPLPMDVMGPYSDPWSGGGINQDQPFSVGVSESISPGNGLLYLFQTDFVVPGRGTDMTVSRFFATPQYFILNSTGSYVPYLYDQFPFCNIGEGWQLNFPWIDTDYVHLWGGTRVAIEWNGNVFNHAKGQQFVLSKVGVNYTLDLQDGMRVNFSADGRPTCIFSNRLLGGGSDVKLNYRPDSQIAFMEDYLGRRIYFNYSDGKLQTASFMGREVTFNYGGNRLASTTDPIGRATTFTYKSTSNPSLLISMVAYPTGGICNYDYGTIQVGTEAIAKVLTYRSTPDGTLFYSYASLDGVITYTQIDQYGGARPRFQGSTEYNFDSRAKKTVVTHFGISGSQLVPMKRTVSWYSADGRISCVESYDDPREMPDVAVSAMDNKGNVVYSKDPIGHEVFSSFAGTSTSNAFYRPAGLEVSSSGKILYDDFNDRVDDGWTPGTAVGYSSIGNYLQNPYFDPSFKVVASSGAYSENVRLVANGEGLWEVILDCLVTIQSSDSDVQLILSNGPSDVVGGIRLWNGLFQVYDGVAWISTAAHCSPNVLYRVTLSLHTILDEYTVYDFCLDGNIVWSGEIWPMNWINYFRILVDNVGTTKSAVIDNVKVFKNWAVSINGLDNGKFAEIYDTEGKLVARAKANGGSAVLALSASNESIPHGYFVIRNITGVIESLDTYREIWGGDQYQYSEPQFINCPLSKSSSGFNVGYTVMDDDIPSGTIPFGYYVNESNPNFALSGSKFHHDNAQYAGPQHGFIPPVGGSPSLSARMINESTFVSQYVYLPPTSCPLSIGIKLQYAAYQYGWTYGWTTWAYWGVDMGVGGIRMGDLPAPGQWSELVVRAGDIGWPSNSFHYFLSGMSFWHYAGDPYWDKTCVVYDPDFGKITLPDVGMATTVWLKKPDGTVLVSVTINKETSAVLDLYAAGITHFPLAGYFSISRMVNPLFFDTPVFTDIYSYDVYSLRPSPFYLASSSFPSSFSKLILGTMQYIDSAKTKSMEAYTKYVEQRPWLPSETKTKNGSSYLATLYTYDSYGNVMTVRDPTGAVVHYSYSNMGTHLSSVWTTVGTQNLSQSYTYHPDGRLRNSSDAYGRSTEYEYDGVGRVTKTTFPRIDGQLVSVRYSYDDVNRIQMFYDENGTAQATGYDPYGRVCYVERLDKNGVAYSGRSYCYEWNGKVKTVSDYSGRYHDIDFVYDWLGRVIKVWYPDNTNLTTVYDDKNNTVISYDQMGRRKDMVYDANDRLMQSIEYLGSTKLFANMTYDDVGDLLTMKDCRGLVTSNEYDDMGRLKKTTYPYGGYQEIWYDSADRVLKKRSEDGTVMVNSYDTAGRLLRWSVSANDYASFTYDMNDNLLTATRNNGGAVVTTSYDYDEWNRVKNETTTVDGTSYRIRYTYDNRSNVISVDVKNGLFKLKYTHDEFDRVTSVRDATGQSPVLIASFGFNDKDQLSSITFGNGVVTNYTLDPNRGWVDQIITRNGQTTLLDLNYTRDLKGRATGFNQMRGYVYDGLGRLTYSNDTSVYGTLAYTYDIAGNRKTQTWGSVTTTYYYDQYGRLSSNKTGSLNTTYQYYASTSMLHQRNCGGITWTFYYDSTGLLELVDKGKKKIEHVEEYSYDALGRRTKSIENSVAEYTIYSGSLPLLTYNPQTSVYTLHAYANGMHVARKTTAESDYYYYHEDAMGSVRLVMKGTQANPWFRTDYLPFGRTFNTTTANPEDFKFLDTRPTKVSGLLPFGERFYDADNGWFLTGDSVLGSLSSPSSNNRWAYCVNDPVNRVDLAGQWPSFQDVCNFVGSLADDAVNLLGDATQALADTAVAVARIGRFAVQAALDVGQRMLDDIKQAAYSVADAVVSGLVAVKEAWDNLDPGLKQWIINGVAFAVSFIPIAGPLISCIIDGTFVDMFSAIMTGNWAMVGMCALAFVPGIKGATKAFKLASHVDDISKITTKLEKHLNKAIKEAKLTAKQERAALKNPNLGKAFKGERIDAAFKNRVMKDSSLEGLVEVTPRFQRGADVYLKANPTVWWDVTTSSQWSAHAKAYGSGGIPLLWG